MKVAILILALFGMAPMWPAVFGDVGVMVLCTLNATRALSAGICEEGAESLAVVLHASCLARV